MSRPDQNVAAVHAAELPVGIDEIQRHWREFSPTLSPDAVLKAGWLGLSRSPMYRAIARGELPVVELGRRKLFLTVPLLKMLGLDLDDHHAVDTPAGHAQSGASWPRSDHGADGPDGATAGASETAAPRPDR